MIKLEDFNTNKKCHPRTGKTNKRVYFSWFISRPLNYVTNLKLFYPIKGPLREMLCPKNRNRSYLVQWSSMVKESDRLGLEVMLGNTKVLRSFDRLAPD